MVGGGGGEIAAGRSMFFVVGGFSWIGCYVYTEGAFALPGLGIELGLWVCIGGVDSFLDRLRRLLRWVVSLAALVCFTWLYFLVNGAGVEFMGKVFLLTLVGCIGSLRGYFMIFFCRKAGSFWD